MSSRSTVLRDAKTHLAAHDARLAAVIKIVGDCTIEPHSHYYQELTESIIGQQLSIKAADSIIARFVTLFGDTFPSPEAILQKNIDELRSVGLSRAKASYVIDLARHIVEGELEVNKLAELSNEEVIKELVAVKGIGEWTAHMFLIFSVGRLDILAVGDLGVRNGIRQLYNLAEAPTPAEIKALAKTYDWHPYESVACWYVWQSLKPEVAARLQN